MHTKIATTVFLLLTTLLSIAIAEDSIEGDWVISLDVGSEQTPAKLPIKIKIHSQVETSGPVYSTTIINGREEITLTQTNFQNNVLTIEAPHYASILELTVADDFLTMRGHWTKRRGANDDATVDATAFRPSAVKFENPTDFLGKWSVKFDDEADPAVGIFKSGGDNDAVHGTFLTTTGDYRYLAGGVVDGQLQLSCFDGAHAFLFRIRQASDQQKLTGEFRSGNWYVTEFSAVRDEDASLPDAFRQTSIKDDVDISNLSFADLDGNLVSLTDERFAGKCRIIEVFGTWCPNCHDAALYLTELDQRFGTGKTGENLDGKKGLSILALAFELTGDRETDSEQVNHFRKRIGSKYPILLAGAADKKVATEQLQLLDRIRSYPTFIFLDESNQVRAVYTGFSGPATDRAHQKLRSQFEQLIEKILSE